MTISPVYWTLIGEIALVIMGILITVIVLVLKDRKNLKDYSLYLKELIKKLKKKIRDHEQQQSQERVQDLIRAMIAHVRAEYQSHTEGDINSIVEEALTDKPSVDTFILITGFQMFSAELSALENSNEPQAAWDKIKNELKPLLQNYLQPLIAAQESTSTDISEDVQRQLEKTLKRVENLEQFKQLYFTLQTNMADKVTKVELLNQKIAELVKGSDNHAAIMAIIENNKMHYIDMGKLLGMDKEQHHDSVAESMNYSDVLISERKDEINHLKNQIAQQFEEIWQLQNSLSGKGGATPEPQALQAGVEAFARQLKDAELCIETMDMEIQTLTAEVTRLQKQQAQNSGTESESGVGDSSGGMAQQERDEMMSCIMGLEESSLEQSEQIRKLEADYAELEAKYLKAVQ